VNTRERSEALFHLIDWHEYTPDTFLKALEEQKPIFLLISAPAWCYWCHVYESEDYLYHPELYPYINENFIAIFIDSDKRPDLTKKYLEGGWPSTTIFTPDFRRIFGFSGPQDPHALKEYFEQIINQLKGRSSSQGLSRPSSPTLRGPLIQPLEALSWGEALKVPGYRNFLPVLPINISSSDTMPQERVSTSIWSRQHSTITTLTEQK
jgi:hypothetical protein